jgi:putative inorganic carbon (HCO3(-)) transporter
MNLSSFLKENFKFVFLIAYVFVELIRYGGSIDFNQFLFYYISIVNTITGIYIILNKEYYLFRLNTLLNNKFFYLYISFLIWGALSYFYAINTSEVLIKSSMWITSFIVFLNCYLLYDKNDFKKISYILIFLLSLEVYSSFSVYWEITKFQPYSFNFNDEIRGVTGNRNLTSLIFCLKIPFVIYLYNTSSKKYFKLFLSLLLVITTYVLILLSSRSSYVYYLAMVIISALYSIVFYRKSLFKILKNQYLIYSFFIAFFFYTIFVGIDNDSSIGNRISSINLEETSTSQRIRFYSHGVNHLKNNLIFGVGLGNWKIKSIDYDSQNMISYVVPYYLHNDFLEAGAELGIIGLFLYLGMFIYLLIMLFVNILKRTNHLERLPYYILFLSIVVYFIDSNLNFPHGRAISQTTINIFFALVLIKLTENEKK